MSVCACVRVCCCGSGAFVVCCVLDWACVPLRWLVLCWRGRVGGGDNGTAEIEVLLLSSSSSSSSLLLLLLLLWCGHTAGYSAVSPKRNARRDLSAVVGTAENLGARGLRRGGNEPTHAVVVASAHVVTDETREREEEQGDDREG